MTVTFFALGTPAPKGSCRAIMVAGHPTLVQGASNVNLHAIQQWERNVRDQALITVGNGGPVFVGKALRVELLFMLERPRSHYRTGKNAHLLRDDAPAYPITKPDDDKLARCTLDALTGVVCDDDSRVVDLHAFKRYAKPGREGARISVEAM